MKQRQEDRMFHLLSLKKVEIWRLSPFVHTASYIHEVKITVYQDIREFSMEIRLWNRFHHCLLSDWGVRVVSTEGRPGVWGFAGLHLYLSQGSSWLGEINKLFALPALVYPHRTLSNSSTVLLLTLLTFLLSFALTTQWWRWPLWDAHHHSCRLPPVCHGHETENSDVMSRNPAKSTLFETERSDEITRSFNYTLVLAYHLLIWEDIVKVK